VLKLFHSYDEALACCEENNISSKQINWEEVVRLRDEARKKKQTHNPPFANPSRPIHK
jgi:hypothetical protein